MARLRSIETVSYRERRGCVGRFGRFTKSREAGRRVESPWGWERRAKEKRKGKKLINSERVTTTATMYAEALDELSKKRVRDTTKAQLEFCALFLAQCRG